MNKRLKRKLDTFQRIQQRSGRYHISQHSPHDQAIREHMARGFQDPRRRQALADLVLLDQRNKI